MAREPGIIGNIHPTFSDKRTWTPNLNGILDGGVVKMANLAAGIPVTYPVAVAATWYLR